MITSFFQPKKKDVFHSGKKRFRRDGNTEKEEDDAATATCSDVPSPEADSENQYSKRCKSVTTFNDEATAVLLSSLTEDTWREALENVFATPSFSSLAKFVSKEQMSATVYPPPGDIWNSLNFCPLNQVKVVIVGQDPYHGPGQAHGMCFSVRPGQPLPPSLRNIYKELQTDVGVEPATHGHLVRWARQGVLLINTVWTVRKGEANSHKNKGWEAVSAKILQALRKRPCVFLMWGKPAATIVENHLPPQKHHVRIGSSHPSPLGATKTKTPFIGSRCFSRCNAALIKMGYEPIDWHVDGPLPRKVE